MSLLDTLLPLADWRGLGYVTGAAVAIVALLLFGVWWIITEITRTLRRRVLGHEIESEPVPNITRAAQGEHQELNRGPSRDYGRALAASGTAATVVVAVAVILIGLTGGGDEPTTEIVDDIEPQDIEGGEPLVDINPGKLLFRPGDLDDPATDLDAPQGFQRPPLVYNGSYLIQIAAPRDCRADTGAVERSQGRSFNARGEPWGVDHSVLLFGSVADARAFMNDYRRVAANCKLGHRKIISLEPPDGLGAQTLAFASKPNSSPAFFTSLFLITRRGAVVHGVGFFPRDFLRAESPDSDHRFERIVRAADRRVRRGLRQAQP